METSGHDLFIKDNAIVDAKEWLLDPENVYINAGDAGRSDTNLENEEYTGTGESADTPKRNNNTKTTLTNSTLEKILARGSFVNITANNEIRVNSDINIGGNSHLTLWSSKNKNSGVLINGNITSTANGNLTIYSSGWVDIHKNITLESGRLNITTKEGDVAFEKGNNLTITGQGTITAGNNKGFRFENVSLNGTGTGLLFNLSRPQKNNSLVTNYFNGTLNISGSVNISMIPPNATSNWYSRYKGRTYWNITHLNASEDSNFNLTIDSSAEDGSAPLLSSYTLNGISFTTDTTFNVNKNAKVNFNIKAPIGTINQYNNLNYALFNGNISVSGGGNVTFRLNASSSNQQTPGVIINSKHLNASKGSSLRFETTGSTKVGFLINNDLTLNATGGNISLLQVEGIDGMIGEGVVAKKNITFTGGNITFGSKKAITEIKGNVTINENTNATLIGSDFNDHKKPLNIKGDVVNRGNLTAGGNVINIGGNLTVENGANLKAITNFTFNVGGLFNNKGNSNISIARGGAKFKDINNTSSLNITTNSDTTYRTIIEGNITNKAGDLNIIDNKGNAEIQIGGNISQKEGNLTISSDKINITKQITIKKGVNGENSDSSTKSQANLTIKTKELKLTQDLNISGFNKAKIVAKDSSNLTIGNSDDSGNTSAKTVTFNNVKDSKISADGHKVTLNSKVKTLSDNDNNTEGGSDNNTGLTITAKDVEVNNNITSHKTVNVSAANGGITTKTGTTINATAGNVEITAHTGSIQGGIESKPGSVTIVAGGDTLAVGNISGNAVTVTANSGALTTLAGSTIKGTESITTSSQSGNIGGKISGKTVNVKATNSLTTQADSKIEATEGEANVTSKTSIIGGTISGGTVEVTATEGLTTQAGSTITGTESVTTSSQSGNIGGMISGGKVEVSATKDLITKSGSEIKATAGEVNVTSATGTIDGTISGNTVNVTANTGDLTVEDAAKIDATGGAATLTATSGKLTTKASSSITSANNQVNLSAKDGSIGGNINAANVTLNTTGALTTVKGSSINANSGTLVINAKDAELNGEASGNHTVVNATNANGSGSVIATTSSRVNITGDLITINGLNIISKNGINTVLLKGVKIDVKYIQPGIASVDEVIEAKRILEKVKDLSDEEREALAKLGVSAVRFAEPNNAITINTQNEFTTRPSSQVTISEGKVCFLIGNGATICTNIADIER
ncbi:beta strand repeat-containing protein [Haemophilus influenzae]|uniref:beta strand repeat-containing protein n=1 Tax=Haemophilus influenzae TaxID=727 RepID=UPI0023AA202C|nr:adhesin [Haemophilus influenzae]